MKPVYLYVTPFFPSPESWRGGYCLDAAKAIAADGRYDVRVIADGNGADYELDGLHVTRMRRLVAPCGLFPSLLAPVNNWLFLRALKRMGINPKDVAVCHSNTINFGHYSSCLKRQAPACRTIVQIHSSYGLDLASGRLGVVPLHAELLYLFYRRVLRDIDLLVFISEKSRQTFGKCFAGTPEGGDMDARNRLVLGRFLPPLSPPRSMVVYNGIDGVLFSPRRIEHDGFVVGCVGNFQPYKGQMTLLEATSILKDKIPGLRVRFIGSGVTLEKCRRYVAANGLGQIATFEPELDHREMPAFYNALDIFVLPSRLEGFGCVYAESLACGTPFICTTAAGVAELVTDEWTVEPLDAAGLADRILRFYRERPSQDLAKDLEIKAVWGQFLDGLRG